MSDRRLLRWATTSARVVVGTALAVVSVIAVTGAVAAGWPTHTSARVSVEATPAPADTVLACDGALLSLGRVVEQAGEYGVAAAQQVVSGPATSSPAQGALAAPGGSEALTFTAPPANRTAAPLAASGSASVEASDLRGFAASACRPPLMESWIVGGATTTGSNDIVLLANPGQVAATVQVTVFGASGAQTSPGGTNRVVPADGQVAIPLSGLVSGEESPVVRVTATGAPVSASLQTSIIRTLTPGGIDQVGAIAAAARTQTIPGVAVVAAPGEAGASNAATIVRLLSPSADTEAQVTVLAADGTVATAAATVPLQTGVPSELELGALAVGTYTIVVEAGSPVVSGAWSTTGFDAGADFAWYAAAPDIATPSLFAVPSGGTPQLTLVNRGAEPVTVELAVAEGGTPEQLAVPAGGVLQRPVAAGSVYSLDPSGPVSAAVSYAAPGAVAGFAVWGADVAAQPITVYP